MESNQLLIGDRAERLIKLAETYREQVKAGLEGINAQPDTPNQVERQLEFRKKIVQAIAKRVEIDHQKNVTIDAVLDLSGFVQISEPIANCQTL